MDVTPYAARLAQALDALDMRVTDLDKRIAFVLKKDTFTRGYTTKALKGIRQPPLDYAIATAQALGVRAAWLLLGEGDMLPDARTCTYEELPGWRLAAGAALERLPRGIPHYAIERAGRRPVLAEPKTVSPDLVIALADFWFRFASDAEVEAAEAEDVDSK